MAKRGNPYHLPAGPHGGEFTSGPVGAVRSATKKASGDRQTLIARTFGQETADNLAQFKAKYGGPRDLKAEARGFAAGKREINRLRLQGK